MTIAQKSSLIAALALAIAPAGALGADHRGTRTVRVAETLVERAPASHPIASAYKRDRFRITRAAYAFARGERWAQGVLIHRDAGAKRTFRYRGWIRVGALRPR